jgi:hypothetical protein
VDYGSGAAPVGQRTEGRDLILEFRVKDLKLTADDFAIKMLVRRKDGHTTFGFAAR